MNHWLSQMRTRVTQRDTTKGISLVEVLIVASLITLIFGGLIGGVRLMVIVIANAKAEAGALALANEQIEYIRSLDYFVAGTVGGVVAGPIPQTSTTSLNGIEYTRNVSIQFIDRPQDGLVTDSTPDPIPQDSKRVVVTMSWNDRGTPRSFSMQTDLIPPGLESVDGGGTIVVNVFNKAIQPVSGATVTVYNDTFSPVISDTYISDANGRAIIPGAPSGSNYQLSATRAGYSIDQTYTASATNPIPNRPHISVATGTVSTLNFQIDALGDLTIETIGQPVKGILFDSFTGSGQIGSSTAVAIGSDEVVLAGSPGSYEAIGRVFSTTTEPSTLDSWESFDFNATTTSNTTVRVRVYEAIGVGTSTTYSLVPDGDLPNNSVGFIQGPINITSIPAGTYDRLALGATLTSSSTNETPILYDWSLTHIESEAAEPNIPFTLTGSKTIGLIGSSPVYKYLQSHTTDGSGSVLIPDMEYDGYSFTLSTGAFTIAEIIGGDPFEKEPGQDDVVTLVLDTTVAYSLRVTVNDIDNDPIAGATVQLQDLSGPYDTTQDTSIYGQTYFSNSLASSTYQLDVAAPGYTSLSVPTFDITGNTEILVQLVESGVGAGPGGGASSTPPSTYLAGYDSRVPVDIDGATLFGTVIDFPVYVDLSDLPTAFFSDTQASGADLRVTESDGQTEVPFELVAIDTGAETGELHFKAPTLSISTSTRFYIYYGSSTASAYAAGDPYGSENVWTNSYLAVYHLEESAAGTGNANVYQDSTSNADHGDDYVTDTDKPGVLGRGQDMGPSGDYISLPASVLDNQTNLTTTFWYRTNNSSIQSILSGANGSQANEYLIWFADENDIEFFGHGPRVYHDLPIFINDSTWRYYASVRDDTSNRSRFYIDGSEIGDSPLNLSLTTLNISNGGVIVGQDQDSVGGGFESSQDTDGPLDELRISSTIRSAAWIGNEFLNQDTPTSFYSVGSIETE